MSQGRDRLAEQPAGAPWPSAPESRAPFAGPYLGDSLARALPWPRIPVERAVSRDWNIGFRGRLPADSFGFDPGVRGERPVCEVSTVLIMPACRSRCARGLGFPRRSSGVHATALPLIRVLVQGAGSIGLLVQTARMRESTSRTPPRGP